MLCHTYSRARGTSASPLRVLQTRRRPARRSPARGVGSASSTARVYCESVLGFFGCCDSFSNHLMMYCGAPIKPF